MSGKTTKSGLLLLALMSYLSILFVLSSIISVVHKNDKDFTHNEVVEYARLFLTDADLKEKGKILDCSGFTQLVYQHFNMDIPNSSAGQFRTLPKGEGHYKPGDLLFFTTQNRQIGHVGIYIGNNLFIHSPGKQKYVRIDSLNHGYWINRYAGYCSPFEPNDEE